MQIINITKKWKGGNDANFPITLSVKLEEKKVFDVTEGYGWGLNGGSFTLRELFVRGIADTFDREESKEIYNFLYESFRKEEDDLVVAKQLIEKFSKNE
ncbi:hypothetical protein [Vibrio sp. SCSIO 43137]|uniref:hypothetical protein n=1 Tax=Vibrio sp. SCSIO 43137 TaxID=3021011 RepID=UPI002307C367|nr:hypothetical protein [Vibrio sp. SCSIO 43137]WCE30919.1 hypothetical protein PK654_06535 [Vibrio sp. SCSIO 43137]